MDNQFSKQVIKILIYSKEEAIRLYNDYIGPEHLLLGIIRDNAPNLPKPSAENSTLSAAS